MRRPNKIESLPVAFIVSAACIFAYGAHCEILDSWLPKKYEKSSVTVLGHFYARDDSNKQYCRLYLKLVNAIAYATPPDTNVTLLKISFRSPKSDVAAAPLEVSKRTTPIDQYSREGKYSHLMLRRDALGFHKMQLFSYNVYDDFSTIDITLSTYPGAPTMTLRKENTRIFCRDNPQALTDNGQRIKKIFSHLPIIPKLLLAKYLGIGTTQFCVFAISNWYLSASNISVITSVGAQYLAHSQLSLSTRPVLLVLIILPRRTRTQPLYTWWARINMDSKENGELLYNTFVNVTEEDGSNSTLITFLATDEITGNKEKYSVSGWMSVVEEVNVKHRKYFPGGSLTLSVPGVKDDAKEVVEDGDQARLTLASVPFELGIFVNNSVSRDGGKTNSLPNGSLCAVLGTSLACVTQRNVKILNLGTIKTDVEFNSQYGVTLRAASPSNIRGGRYNKKVLVTLNEVDQIEKSDTFSYECPLSEDDFSNVDYDGHSLESRVVKTGNGGNGGTVVVDHEECKSYCEQKRSSGMVLSAEILATCETKCRGNLGVVCVGKFGEYSFANASRDDDAPRKH